MMLSIRSELIMTKLGTKVTLWFYNVDGKGLSLLGLIAGSMILAGGSFITFERLGEGFFNNMPYPILWLTLFLLIYLGITYHVGWVWIGKHRLRKFVIVLIFLNIIPALFGYYVGMQSRVDTTKERNKMIDKNPQGQTLTIH